VHGAKDVHFGGLTPREYLCNGAAVVNGSLQYRRFTSSSQEAFCGGKSLHRLREQVFPNAQNPSFKSWLFTNPRKFSNLRANKN
jgi:hypothetical protein